MPSPICIFPYNTPFSMVAVSHISNHRRIDCVSLVIPTKNRAESLAVTLDALKELAVPEHLALQVIIVLDGCTDDSRAIADQWQLSFEHSVICVETEGLGAGGARNAGIDKADGVLVGFIDDDVIPDVGWLKKHLEVHERYPEAFVTLGAMRLPQHMQLPPWNEWEVLSLAGRYRSLETGNAEAGPEDLFTANAMMPLDILKALGGFNVSLKRAEDVELASRLADQGVKFRFLAEAGVVHCPVRTLRGWKKIPVNYAKAHWEMAAGDPDQSGVTTGAPNLDSMHWLTQFAVLVFSKRSLSSDVFCAAAQGLGIIAHRLQFKGLSYAAFSSVYNVLYFGTLHRLRVNELPLRSGENP